MRNFTLAFVLLAVTFTFQNMFPTEAQQTKPPDTVYLLRPAAVFDGEAAELREPTGEVAHAASVAAAEVRRRPEVP